MNATQNVKKDDRRVLSLAADIIRGIGAYAEKKGIAARTEILRKDSFAVFSVTNLKRVIKPRSNSGQPHPRMEDVREGKFAWILGALQRSTNGKQLCVDQEGHGYIVGQPDSSGLHREVEQITINTLSKMHEDQLEEIQAILAKAR